MAGNKKRGVVIQPRDRHLLSELAVMRFIDHESARIIGGFGVTRRANWRLLALARAGLLRRFFVGTVGSGRKAVYTLSSKGADLVLARFGGVHRPEGKVVTGDRFVEHQSGVNEIYVGVKYGSLPPGAQFLRWHIFRQSISEAIKITPDGYFEIATTDGVRSMFLEVDLGTEALKIWQQKGAYYLQLAVSGEFPRRFGQQQFRVLVVANSERRLQNIRGVVSKSIDKIFWFATLENIHRDGFWSPTWLRPKGDQRLPLI